MRTRTPTPWSRFTVSLRAALAAILAVALSVPVVAAVAARPSQLPVSPPIGQIRISNRAASNRMWFQTGNLMACRAETQSGCLDPGGPTRLEAVAANGVTLREFIGFAYLNDKGALTRSQVIGGPEWADTVRFDLIVPMPNNSPVALMRDSDQITVGGQAIPLLQQMLTDHFQLRLHKEQRTLAALNLVKSETAGPDLRPSTATCDPLDAAQRCDFRSGPGFMSVRGMTMRHLAMQLSWNFPALKLPVVDKTGLTGKYDYSLSYVPALLTAPNPKDPDIPIRRPAADRHCSSRSNSALASSWWMRRRRSTSW